MADKGGNIVVLKREEYNKELNRLVGDTNTYKKLRGNPTNKLKAPLKSIVKQAQQKGILTNEEAMYLVADEFVNLSIFL